MPRTSGSGPRPVRRSTTRWWPLGSAYQYVASYCQEHARDMLAVCTELVDRTCAAVELILSTATELEARQEAA